MKNPLISIIMPAYNAAKYISNSIQSALDQTYEHWELIVVNDGSTDNTHEVVGSFSDNRIIYFEKTNSGVSDARNYALEKIQGQFFCFLDADDILPPNSLKYRLELFSDPGVTFSDGSVKIFDSAMQKIIDQRSHTFSGNPLEPLCRLDGTCFFGPTWMIRRLENVDYQFLTGLSHGEELLFYISIAHLGRYKATKHVVYHYRTGHLSAMSNLSGLEKGYRVIHSELKKYSHVNSAYLNSFLNKARSIMIRSYLANVRPFQAFKLWLTFK